MTKKQYIENQKNPKRIKVTERGKQLTRQFMDIALARACIDYPKGKAGIKLLKNRLAHYFFYFTKWIMEYEIDLKRKNGQANSQIWIYTKYGKDITYCNNVLFDDEQTFKVISKRANLLYKLFKAFTKEGI